jgi:hypothetical protein
MASHFIWYELITNDPAAAAAFYGQVLGWTARDAGQAGMEYRILSRDGLGVGGLLALPPAAAAAGMAPAWFGYVSVSDVDASVARTVSAGGVVHMPAMNIPGIGRFAMLADPQGASLYVMTPVGEGQSTAFAPGKPGHGGWHELHARDWKTALGFYRAEFGWDEVRAMDMGPLGTYLLFNDGSGDAVGGMFNDADAQRAYWLYYFNVDAIEPASRRVTENGGQLLMEPHQVPTGDWIVQARDPQGARFALVGPKASAVR